MGRPEGASRRPSRNDMRVSSGDFISWDTWAGRTTAYVVIGNDNHHIKSDLWVSLRASDHHDEYHESVPSGATLATAEEAAGFVERSRSRWADGHPAVPESAVERWATTMPPRQWDRNLMVLESPLFIGTRLMAAAEVGSDGSTLHIEPLHRDQEDRVVWRYVIEDGSGNELIDDTDLRSGSGAEVDPQEAMTTLVVFLETAAESHRRSMAGEPTEHAEILSPEVRAWAGAHESELAALAADLDGPQPEHLVPQQRHPYLRPAGHDGPVPSGWTAEPVGNWDGSDTEVVYNTRLYDVMVVPATTTEDREGDLASAGWRYQGTDGVAVMWVLDRVAAARTALDRAASQPPPEIGGLSR